MIEITDRTIAANGLIAGLATTLSGSVVSHVGIVRPPGGNKRLVSIRYEADDQAARQDLSLIEAEIRQTWPIEDIVLSFRTGDLDVGDAILAVAVSAPHSADAFQACSQGVDRIRTLPSRRKTEVHA